MWEFGPFQSLKFLVAEALLEGDVTGSRERHESAKAGKETKIDTVSTGSFNAATFAFRPVIAPLSLLFQRQTYRPVRPPRCRSFDQTHRILLGIRAAHRPVAHDDVKRPDGV